MVGDGVIVEVGVWVGAAVSVGMSVGGASVAVGVSVGGAAELQLATPKASNVPKRSDFELRFITAQN